MTNPGNAAATPVELPRLEQVASRFLAGVSILLVLGVVLGLSDPFGRVGVLGLVSAAALGASALLLPRRLRPVVMLLVVVVALLGALSNVLVVVTTAIARNRDLQLRRDAARSLGYEFDGRSRRDTILDSMRTGRPLVPSVDPQGLLVQSADGRRISALSSGGQEVLPLAGVSNVETLLCNEVGKNVEYEADERGFRNPRGSWAVPIDVAIVGDSFAHGVCVSDSETLSGHLRLQGFRVLLTAYSGNGPLLELATVREYLAPVRPLVTVWALYEGNDLDDNLPRESASPLLRRYVEDQGYRQDLYHRQAELDTLLTDYVSDQLQRESELDGSIRDDSWWKFVDLGPLRTFFRNLVDRPQGDLVLFERVLGVARREVAAWNGQLVLLYLPAEERWRGSGALHRADVARWDVYRASVRLIAERLKVPFLDALPALESAHQQGVAVFYPFKAHYAPAGYESSSKPLIDWLRKLRRPTQRP